MKTQTIPVEELDRGVDLTRRDQWGRYMIVPPGETQPVGYTRVTTVAKALDPGGGLAPWKASMTATGMLMRRGLRAQWEALLSTTGDPWYHSEQSKAECKRLVEECAAVGGANDRREVGSALHAITALSDKGLPTPHLTEETEAELKAYRTGLALNNIDIDRDMVELTVVLDEWRVAGTLDRLALVPGFDKPLIADLKTGADLSYSWQSIAVQLAAYAHADDIYVQGANKDGSKDSRLVMPEVDQQWGMVFWLPAGDAELEVFLVDLNLGWEAFDASMWTRAWRNRGDLNIPLSEFQYDTTEPSLEKQLERSLEAQGIVPPPNGVVVDYQPVRDWLQDRINVVGEDRSARALLRQRWPSDLPTLKASDAHTSEQLDIIDGLLGEVERECSLGFPTSKPPLPTTNNTGA